MDYEDQHSEYSEDFEDETVQDNESSAHDIKRHDQTKAQSYAFHRRSTERSGDRGSSSKTKKAVSKKRASTNSRLSPYKHTVSLSGSSPKDRVISARVHEISTLQNELAEKKSALQSLHKENKLLVRLQARQEKELNKLQHQEGELPQILARHAEEVRALKEQLRRSHEAARAAEKRLTEVGEELHRASGRVKELEDVVKKKDLMERAALTLELQQANDTISAKDKKITELERNSEVLAKNHAQEVRALLSKNKTLSQEAEELKDVVKKTHHNLKEKEKELDVLNIYSQRISCSMPKTLSTHLHTPLMDGATTQTEFSAPPTSSVSLHVIANLKTTATQTESFFQPLTPSAPPMSKQIPSASPPPDIMVASKVTSGDRVPGAVVGFGLDKESPTKGSPHIEAVTRAVNAFDGSHVESMSAKAVLEMNVTMPDAAPNATSLKKSQNNSTEDEDCLKKEILLAKLRALSNGPPASVPLSTSTLARNVAEPAVAGSQLGTRNTPAASDKQMVPPALLTDAKDTAHKLHTDIKEIPPVLHMTTELRKENFSEASNTSSKPSRPTGSEPSIDSKQLLLAKLMAVDTASPAEQTSESKVGSKPAKAPASEARIDPAVSKQLLLAKLMAIDTSKDPAKKGSSTAGVPDVLRGEQQSDNTSSGSPSSHSTPNKLENMHRGKPAFATNDDPFGFRIISAEKKKQKEPKRDATGGTFMTENESELLSQPKPKFGRRTQAPPQGGNPSEATAESSLLSSVQVPQQPYQPSFGSLLKDTSVTTEHIGASAFGGPQTHALDGSRVGVYLAEGGKDSKDGMWQKNASMHAAVASTLAQSGGNQRPAKPLLPLRAKATESTFDIMPGAIQGDEDIEEITL